jgi:hypothetical protein
VSHPSRTCVAQVRSSRRLPSNWTIFSGTALAPISALKPACRCPPSAFTPRVIPRVISTATGPQRYATPQVAWGHSHVAPPGCQGRGLMSTHAQAWPLSRPTISPETRRPLLSMVRWRACMDSGTWRNTRFGVTANHGQPVAVCLPEIDDGQGVTPR